MRTPWRTCLYSVLAACLALPLAFTYGCTPNQSKTSLTVAGSTTVLPIAEIGAEKFEAQEGVHVLVSGLGSSAGIEAALNRTCDIATSSRDLTVAEADTSLIKIPIAHDGIAVIVNEHNPVTNLSLDQLRDVYAGKITNWKELGGDDLPILLVNRDEASGTREAFHKLVMKKTPFDKSSAVLPGTGQVRDVVSRTPGAIGYISFGFVNTEFDTTKVKALTVDGIEPTEKSIGTGEYPISRDLFFITNGKAEGNAQKFIDFILSDQMASTIKEAGYIPISTSERSDK